MKRDIIERLERELSEYKGELPREVRAYYVLDVVELLTTYGDARSAAHYAGLLAEREVVPEFSHDPHRLDYLNGGFI